MDSVFILIIGGLVVFLWLFLWLRQRQALGARPEADLNFAAGSATGDAVLVAREHGQLIYTNEIVQQWANADSAEIDLEQLAAQADPSDSFLDLFARETQNSFKWAGRWVEGTSHRVPSGSETRIVVTIRELKGGTASGAGTLDMSKAIGIANEIGETLNASQGMEQTLQALVTIVTKYIDAEAGLLMLWDEQTQLLTPRGFVGDTNYVLQLAEAGGAFPLGRGISGWVAQHRKPLLVEDVSQDAAVQPILENDPYQSFIAIPLELNDRLIGVLKLACTDRHHFNTGDLSLLQAVAQPITTAIYNAELYAEQSQRIDDLASLQRITPELEEAKTIYGTITEKIARLMSAEICGVLIYDDREQTLLPETPFYGLPTGLVQRYRLNMAEGSDQRDIWTGSDSWVSNDLVDEPMADEMGLRILIDAAGLYNTALMPLQTGGSRFGMLQIANKKTHGGFTLRDMQQFRLLASQAAVIVAELRMAQRDQVREGEIEGLQSLAQSFGAMGREEAFFETTTSRIAQQLGASICGILLYNEAEVCLDAQLPFYGVSDETVQSYRIGLEPGSPLEQIWREEDYWFTNNTQTSGLMASPGLAEHTAALALKKVMFVPLASAGRRIGAIELADKANGADFTIADARLMLIFTTQVAGMIENSRLFREVQRRADDAERLRRIAELAGAIATPDDDWRPVLEEVARLMDSTAAYVNVIDVETGSLITQASRAYGVEIDLNSPFVFPANEKGFEHTVAMTRRPFFSHNVATDKRILPAYKRASEAVGIRSSVLVPLVVGDQSLGELGVMNRFDPPYGGDDIRLMNIVAIQLAAALDRLRLYEATGQNLRRRVQELDAISRVSNELAATLDVDSVLEIVRAEAIRAGDAQGSSIAMLAPAEEWPSPDQPVVARRLGERMTFGKLVDIETRAFASGHTPVIVYDYADDDNLKPVPPNARSGLAAAIMYEEAPVGVVHLWHTQPMHFDTRASTFIATLAAKASLSYGNNRRFLENQDSADRLRRRVEQLSQIFELGQMLQTTTDTGVMLEAIAYSIQQSCNFDIVLMTLVDEDAGIVRRVTQAGLPVEQFEARKLLTMPLRSIDRLLNNEKYRLSESVFLPFERVGDWYVEGLEALGTAYDGNRTLHPAARDDWRDGDMLLVPILGAGGERLGVISLDRPFDGKRPDRSVIEVLEIFAHQAAATIENSRLYLASLRNAEQEARLNEIMEAIAVTLDLNGIVEGVARGVLRLLPFMRMSIALLDSESGQFEIVRVAVQNDDTVVIHSERHPTLEGTALGRTFELGEDFLYQADDPGFEIYTDLQAWGVRGEKTALVVPLITGGLCLGAMHLGSDLINAFGFQEYRGLMRRIAGLVAVAIQNARLFTQAINLRAFNESVVQSIQQGIIVLDRAGRVITVNEYMRRRFRWTDALEDGARELFTLKPEFAPLLQRSLQAVLENGQPQEIIGQSLMEGGDRLTLNFYLYPLQSADSIRGAVLLVEDTSERARLERNVEARANQLAALTEVSSRITAILRREDVITLAVEEMQRVIGYDTMSLWGREGSFLILQETVGQGMPAIGTRLQIESDARLLDVVNTQRTSALPGVIAGSPLPGEAGMRSWLGAPLLEKGQVVGVITLGKAEAGFYDAQAEQAAGAFANQVAVALANAQLFEDARYRTERLALLNNVSVALSQSLDTENVLEVALREIASAIKMSYGRAYLLDRETNQARGVVDYPRGDTPPFDIVALDDEKALLALAARGGQSVFIANVHALPHEHLLRRAILARGLQGYVYIPLNVSGQISGGFEYEIRTPQAPFDPERVDLARIIASQAAIAALNSTLLEQTLSRTRDLESLLEAAQSTAYTLDLREVFASAIRLTLQALDMDDCSVMMLDFLTQSLTVQMDINRVGDENRITPAGTVYDLRAYPAKMRAIENHQILVIRVDDPAADPTEVAEMRAAGDRARMLVPLVVREQPIGLMQIELQSVTGRQFTSREVRMAQALAAQAATAIENARLSTETSQQVEQSMVINELSRAISSTMSVDEMIRIVHNEVPSLTAADVVYLALYDAESRVIGFPMAVENGKDFTIPPRLLGEDEVSFIIRRRSPLSLGGENPSPEDVRRNLRITNMEGEWLRFMGVPLIAGDQVVGVLAVRDNREARPFGLNDQRILQTIGTQLGAAIQNARLYERVRTFADELNARVDERTIELAQERDRLDTLYRMATELGSTLDVSRVLESGLSLVANSIRADEGAVYLIDPINDELHARANVIVRDGQVTKGDLRQSDPGQMLASYIMRARGEHALRIGDLHQQSYWNLRTPGASDWRSAIAVVLETTTDPLGVMVFLSHQPDHFAEDQLRLVTAAATQVASSVNNADLYTLIRDQAERMATLLRAEQEEAEKNSAILEGIADGVMLANANGIVVLFNDAAERILGLPRDYVLGQSLARLAERYPEAVTWITPIHNWSRERRYSPTEELTLDRLEVGRKVVSARAASVYTGDQLLGTVTAFRDVTRDVEVDRMKSEFISNVTHELRTPLTSIVGYIDLLMMGGAGAVTDVQKRHLATIKRNSDRLGNIVEDLLSISNLDSGVERMNIESVEVRQAVEKVVKDQQNLFENRDKQIELTMTFDPDMPPIDADRAKFGQIVGNIVSNAFNYTYDGGRIDVGAKLEDDGQHILIQVKDTGIGIPEEFRERIWNRFERYDEHALVMDVAGTGLGLPIVKTLVEMHRGEIWFESEVNHGSTFYIRLPVRQPEIGSTGLLSNTVSGAIETTLSRAQQSAD